MIKKIGYLGKNNEHLTSLNSALREFDIEVVSIGMSTSFQNSNKVVKAIVDLYNKFSGTNDAEYLQKASSLIADNSITVLIAYWGTNIIPDIIAIKKYNPNLKIILNVMCHPMGLTSISVMYQNYYLKYANRFIDGYVYSNMVMHNYFKNKILPKDDVPNVVVPMLLSRKDIPVEFLQPCSNQPNLLFLGRPDWWKGQPTDNLSEQLKNAMKAGIHVYHAGDLPSHDAEERRHVFGYMSLSELKTYATQFDVSLIMYNLEAASAHDRFDCTIPDRLIASVGCGVPIALPKQGYRACKEFLEEYEAVIEFDDFNDLYCLLSDRGLVAELKDKSRKNSGRYILERHIGKLVNFLGLV